MRMSLRDLTSFGLLNEAKNACCRGNLLAMALRKGWQTGRLVSTLFVCAVCYLKSPLWDKVSFVVDDYMFTYSLSDAIADEFSRLRLHWPQKTAP